jgi:hypothetical protein
MTSDERIRAAEKFAIIEAGRIVAGFFDELPDTVGTSAIFWLLVDGDQCARTEARRLRVAHTTVLRARQRLLKLVRDKNAPGV